MAAQQQQGRIDPNQNCLGESVAYLLGRSDVPNFAGRAWRWKDRGCSWDMIDHMREWLKQEGYEMTLKSGDLSTCTGRVILLATETALGSGPPGHAVVAENQRIVHDPLGHPERSATFPYSQQIEIIEKQKK